MRAKVTISGKVRIELRWVTRRVATQVPESVQGPPGPCYLGDDEVAAKMPASFWTAYRAYA